MYSIVMKDGKIINIDADVIMYNDTARMIELFNDEKMVARIDMNNIVGWIEANYMSESED